MKKLLVLFLMAVLFINSSFTVFASSDNYVYVSIANGDLVLAYEKVSLSDADNDGKLTINDALYLAHEAKFEGGAEAGYASSVGAYGLKIDKLWGYENGDSFGYYLNNASAMSLGDEVKNGDHVYAFCYTDLEAWSDTYSYFNTASSKKAVGDTLSLTLYSAGYDESWNPISLPVNNANLLINGVKQEIKTDEQGKAIVTFDENGTYVISAVSESQNLVPAVCVVTVSEKNNETIPTDPAKPGDISSYAIVMYSVIAMISIFVISRKRKSI